MRAGGFPGNPGGLVVSIVKTAGGRAPAHQARGRGRSTWRPTERSRRCSDGTAGRRQRSADPKDYYRFTWDSLEYLFRRFSHVEVHHHGSRVQAIWEMINAGGRSRVLLNILNPFFALFEFQQTRFPLGFVI